jgi:hypothetical protein
MYRCPEPDKRRDLVGPGGVAANDDHAVAPVGQGLGDGTADAGGAASNENGHTPKVRAGCETIAG